MFYQNVLACVDKHVPLKKVDRKSLSFRSKPWISNRIKRMISKRDKYLRKFKRTYSKDAEYLYKKFRNKVVNENRQAKKDYYNKYFVKHKDNMKMLWTGIRSVINMKHSGADSIISHLVYNGSEINDSKKMLTYLMNLL